MRTSAGFTSIVQARIAATAILDNLAERDAVVLERTARGGGATNWYCCRDSTQLAKIEKELRPGSVVSFYFDDRLRKAGLSTEVKADMERLLAESGEMIFGTLRADCFHVDATIVVSAEELKELLWEPASTGTLFYGAFPSRENDGTRAITITLPHSDYNVRPHPH